MVEIVIIGIAVIFAIAVLVAVGSMAAGFVVGLIEMLLWGWDRLHGGHKIAPWLKNAPAGRYNRVPIPAEMRARVMARDGFRCVECGVEDDLTVDHIVPRVLGGSNDPSNLETLCRPCNSRKGPRGSHGRHVRLRNVILRAWMADHRHATNGRHR